MHRTSLIATLIACGAPAATPHPAAPPAAAATADATCSPNGTWQVTDPRPASLAMQDHTPLFTTWVVRRWREDYVIDHDGVVNAVVAATVHGPALDVVLRPDPKVLTETQVATLQPAYGAPAPAPDPDGPHAKPPTSLSSGVFSLRDPYSYACTLAADCMTFACTFDNREPFTMKRSGGALSAR